MGSASKLQCLKIKMLNTKTFLMTVSVPGDISTECVTAISKWVRKTTVHAYVVTERGESDRAHLHACLVYKEPREPRKIRDNVWARFVKVFHSDAKPNIAVKVQVMPGHDWYDTYLQKECDKDVHVDTYDREKITDYFPPAAVQEELQTRAAASKVAAPHILKDVTLWESLVQFDNTPLGALEYLRHRMFVLRDMIPIADDRKLTDKAYIYWCYRNKVITASANQIRLLATKDAVYDFSAPR